MTSSIFEEYYSDQEFTDRYVEEGASGGLSVIIPIMHVNELWRANLISIFREVPVFELLIGDGGCDADAIEVLNLFPRVRILDQKQIKTLGYCLRQLIESVQTEHFIYFHSDVYLPSGWFDHMMKYKDSYDWYGCRVRHTIMLESDHPNPEGRPYWGSQIGRKEAFIEGLKVIDDDYVWRQEDFVLSEIVKSSGFKEGGVDDVFHYHQTIQKKSPVISYDNFDISISRERSFDEEKRIWTTQVKGIVKYLKPNSAWAINDVAYGIDRMLELGVWKRSEIFQWINDVNPDWLPYARRGLLAYRMKRFLSRLAAVVKKLFRSMYNRFFQA